MRARRILSTAGYEPEQVAHLTEVLEAVWARTKCYYSASEFEPARERLAMLIIDLAGREVHEEPGAFQALVQVTFERQIERVSQPLNGRN